MSTIAITGSASGIGAATAVRLREGGHRVIGVDLRNADLECDLSTTDGRRKAIDGVVDASGGVLDGLVTCAGIAGSSTEGGARLVSINYFGTVAVVEGLRPALAQGSDTAVVCVSSNSTTCQPNWPIAIADACLAGDEDAARAIADEQISLFSYPASKAAVAWWVRTNAPTEAWIGAGIRLNAIAPGVVETPMVEGQRADPMIGPHIDAFPVPRGRNGTPDEAAAIIDFLLGSDSRMLCGTVLFADGGTDAMLRARDFPARWSINE